MQLLGGVGNEGAFEATLLTQRLATLLNCPAYLLPSQSIEQSVQSKQRIVQMEEVEEVLQRFDSITLAIVGIGDLEPSQLLRNSGNYYTEDMLRLLAERGAVGDICLRYFDAEGQPVLEEDEEFVVSVSLPKLRAVQRVLGLAGGLNKVQSIRGALKGGYLDILITDLDTAQAFEPLTILLETTVHDVQARTTQADSPPWSATPATWKPSAACVRWMPPPTRRCCSRPPRSPNTPTCCAAPWRHAKGDVDLACDHFAVAVGARDSQGDSGRISTEVDARLSFDEDALWAKANQLIALYDEAGVGRDRVLIKLASTWEGIRTAERLEKAGIADQPHPAVLLRPGPGLRRTWRVPDLAVRGPHLRLVPQKHRPGLHRAEDPGVQSVTRIYNYYKANHIPTVVMGASFRTLSQIEQLAGCDRLTISPDLLHKLGEDHGTAGTQAGSRATPVKPRQSLTEAQFRWASNEDAMATEKLAEGIRQFARDQEKLEKLLGNA